MEYNAFSIAANDINVTLLKACHFFANDGYSFEKMKNPYSRIYFVKEGTGTISYNGQQIPFQGGMIYLIPAELEFSLDSSYFEKIFVHLSLLTLEKYDIFAGLDQVYTIPCSVEEYETLYGYLSSQSYYDKLKLKMHLLSVFSRIVESYSLPTLPIRQYSELVRKILDYIQENLSLKLRVCDISAELFVSESKIRDAFRKEMGIPIGKYIDDMVFAKARQLLAVSTISISKISTTLGFCDQFYFSRQFSKKFGVAPSQFRKML